MFKFSKTSIRNIIIIPIGFLLILFLSKPSLSSEDALLLALNIECSGKNNDWSKSWSDNFFAISTPYTLQGSRYWIASGKDEGDKKYDGDIGQNIFIGSKTKKDFRITGEGTWLKNKGDVFKFKFLSKGNKSIIEHLSAGVDGTGGKGKHKRECEIKLLSQVDAFDGIRVEKYLSVRDKKIEKLLSEINDYKNIEDTEISNQETVLNSKNNNSVEDKDREIILLKNQIDNLKWELKQKDSNANQDVDVSKLQTNGEEIQNITKKYEKEITLLKNQISTLTKEKNTTDNKIIKLTNELADNDSELDYKSKFEELSLQFESLNAELENITKINEQLDNEITSLKNDVDKNNIAEKEDKKIVQQKSENANSEENQNNDNKNVETVSVNIVKDEELINLDVSDFKKLKTTEIEDILYDSVTFGFYSDGALFESQYSPNSKGNEGQFSISFSENEKYTGIYKVTKSKVCFLLDGTDNWECSLIYKKNKNDKIYYWATKGEIFAKTTHILTKSEYVKMDKNPINTKTKSAEKTLDNKSKKVENQETAEQNSLTEKLEADLRRELKYVTENKDIFWRTEPDVFGNPQGNLGQIPIEYKNFEDKKIFLKGNEEIKIQGKKCGMLLTELIFNQDGTGIKKTKTEKCDWSDEYLGVWTSSDFAVAFAYMRNTRDGMAVFVESTLFNFYDEYANNDLFYNILEKTVDGYLSQYSYSDGYITNYLDLKKGEELIIGAEQLQQIADKKTLDNNTKNKTVLFGVSILDDPNNYEISNKRLGEEFVQYGNSLTEIFEADYGQKLEFNFYDTKPPIKNNSFFDYKIRTTSLNGKEIISSINARADCPLKGLEGCTEFSDQISNALYEKYGFIDGEEFEIVDDKGNFYILQLSILFTKEGELIISGYDYLDADGLWMSLGINWSEESLMSKFEIDPESKKKLDTNF